MRIDLADLHAAAQRVASAAETAALAAEQARDGGNWQTAHAAWLKARTARAVADAIAEVSAEL